MKVAALIWQGKRWTGGWNYYLNMARILREHGGGVRVQVFAPADIGEEARQEAELATGFSVGVLPSTSRVTDAWHLIFGHNRRLAAMLAEAGVDMVIEQASFLGRRFPIPIISWIADFQHKFYPQYFSFMSRISRDVGYWAQVNLRENVYVSSDSAAGHLRRFLKNAKANVHVVRFSIKPTVEVSGAALPSIISRYGIEGRYAFLPNQLWRHKNHSVAIRAFGLLASRGVDLKLIMSGRIDGSDAENYHAELMKLASDCGAGPNLVWLGNVPYGDLLHLISGSEMLINPSRFEGWSTTVEEAKAIGCRMVLSDIDVHIEQAADRAKFFHVDSAEDLALAIEGMLKGEEGEKISAEDRDSYNQRDRERYAESLTRMFHAASGHPSE